MGTRSLTFILDMGTPLVCIYRQFDGYPDGHGKDLANMLWDKKICNGIGINQSEGNWSNGMDDLAPQIIYELKKDHYLGGIYIMPIDTRNVGEEYIYTIYLGDDNAIFMKIEDVYEKHVIFDNHPIALLHE